MNRHIIYISAISIAVSACSGISTKRASGDFEYAKSIEAKSLKVPEGLHAPEKSEEFFITNDINHKGPVGANVDIRAPSLVLPIAASSRVEQNSSEAKIWFDQVLDDKDLQVFIYQALQDQLTEDGVALSTVNAQDKIFESDWYHSETESGYWLFKTVDVAESMRFRFQFESKPHGRSVALKVSVVEYMKTNGSGATKQMDVIDKQRAEMSMLNKIVNQVDYKYRKVQQEHRLMRANQQLVSVSENSAGESAYIVEMELDSLWSNMPIFFEDYGFTIADLDESKKIYYVDFVKPDAGFWDSIWGDGVPVIEIENGRYQFDLTAKDNKSLLIIKDSNGNVLSAETMNKIFPVMGPALSFRNIF
ncbi:outer membrane protein assembly factor BamC [Colwelliaceae bacterium 6471]